MKDPVRTFKNELGNTITVQAAEKAISGVDGILFSIEGPTSKTELHVTREEAKALIEELARFFIAR